MHKINIHSLLSIEIDEGLENTNRIYDFLNSINQEKNTTSTNKIKVLKVDKLNITDHREYLDGIYISPNSLIDIKYGIEIILKKNEIILNTKFRFIEWLMYSIQLGLLRNESVLIHGAAVSKDNKATLFPSWGGVGKTAILNDFAKKYGYKIIGDDLFILNKKGDIFSFPKPMVLYPYHKNLFPEIFKKNPSLIPTGMTKTVSRLVPKIKKILSPFPVLMNYARNHNPQVKWALPYEVFGAEKICDRTVSHEIFWLERSNNESSLLKGNENISSQILGSTINEFDQRVVLCINVLMGLGLLSNDDYLDKWYNILNQGLAKTIKGRINVNNKISIDEIGGFIKNLLNENDS